MKSAANTVKRDNQAPRPSTGLPKMKKANNPKPSGPTGPPEPPKAVKEARRSKPGKNPSFSLGKKQIKGPPGPPPPPGSVTAKPKPSTPSFQPAPLVEQTSNGGTIYSYAELQEMKTNRTFPDGMDTHNLETYLDDDEFEDVFQMTRPEYNKLQKWKKKQRKQRVNLF